MVSVQGTPLAIFSSVVSQPATMLLSFPSAGTAQKVPSTAASGTCSVYMLPSLSVTAEPRLTIRL